MRRNHLPWLALLLLSVFTYLACQKECRPGFPLDPGNPQSEKVTANISGRVRNERQEPVEGATVTAGNVNTTTNYNGYFNLENASVATDAAFIKGEYSGLLPRLPHHHDEGRRFPLYPDRTHPDKESR